MLSVGGMVVLATAVSMHGRIVGVLHIQVESAPHSQFKSGPVWPQPQSIISTWFGSPTVHLAPGLGALIGGAGHFMLHFSFPETVAAQNISVTIHHLLAADFRVRV